MHANPGQIRKGRKFEQVLEGARDVFLRDGFEGANVDAIARAAGVSKATLYSYFPDKRLLFIEVFRLECDRQTMAALDEIDFADPPAVVLRRAAEHMVASFLSEFNQAVFRVCVAESDRFPELGAAFYRSGPLRLHDELVAYLARIDGQGAMAIPDPHLAADQFIELCKADLYLRHLLRVTDTFTPDEIARVIDGAVATFTARYAA
ncbi:TetR/AcrR family transcriptional regulator [Rhodovulum euryhalinum]|uniref:TetR family transcriptional regulator n=1 Tax=Rhodovulum euryhalinum TaxID=35805 RepID=A0A4R2KLP1_9RHOB|nr:TetR/AcrR family transcriptional regulator [Rhodovulum euryhalinum]TCO73532.1 TetR family transcriptional regulator [Rhodovulum euryhalinum]